MPLRDRILGCLLGGAIGDAVGGVPERGDLSLSDDTQLTLATCEAIQAAGSSPEAIAAAFTRWFLSGLPRDLVALEPVGQVLAPAAPFARSVALRKSHGAAEAGAPRPPG
jgi:ADP-ribosylglycohydrolase